MSRYVLAAVAALMVASACSGGGGPAPTAQPSTSAPATPLPSVAATVPAAAPTPPPATPIASPLSTATPTSVVVPTPSGGGLMALLPTQLGGLALQSQIIPAEMLDLSPEYLSRIETLVASVGGSMADLELVWAGAASGPGSPDVNVEAIRVPGADGAALVQAEVARWLGQMVEGTETMPITIGGKDVIQVGEQDPSFPKYARYVYGVGDTVITVYGSKDELIAELFSQLP